MEPSLSSHRRLWIALVAVAALIVVGLIAAWLFSSPQTSSTAGGQSPVSLPVSTSTQNVNGIPLTTQQGNSVATPDFINNGVTLEEPQNPGVYVLAGSTGHCTTPDSCPRAGSADDFHIEYDAKSTTFNIALTQEPIGQARLHAEQFLKATLGISEQQMCSLRYYLGTTVGVNDTYAGKNLGFSFCPGATPLPN